MISADLLKTHSPLTGRRVLDTSYSQIASQPSAPIQLSPVAQAVLSHFRPSLTGSHLPSEQPEVIALRILDFLSSKQGYIRRKGHTFRTRLFYERTLPHLTRIVSTGKPLELSSICLCTSLANVRLSGESPYPHMASYIAFENVHKIAAGIRNIYNPGSVFTLGYEGTLFQELYFHNDEVVRNTLTVLNELNWAAHVSNNGPAAKNPIRVVDAMWMIEQAFGSISSFEREVAYIKKQLPLGAGTAWAQWYRKATSSMYFPSESVRSAFTLEKSQWREAVHKLKYRGGKYGKGFVGFSEDTFPFTPSGRKTDMLALQLVPRNSYLPHQRSITYDPATNRWEMMSYAEIKASKEIYAPCFIPRYLYPFYYEKCVPVS